MKYSELLLQASPGLAVVRGQLAHVAGGTCLYEASKFSPQCLVHSHLPIATFHTISDFGEPSPQCHAERIANAKLYAHCRNKFDLALQAVKEARKDLLKAGAKHEANRLRAIISDLETVKEGA
jgi:hypothetical protein